MEIERIITKLMKSNMYVISENNRSIIVDPWEVDKEIDNVDYIFITHEHYDHISGVDYWKEKTGAKVIASKQCADMCRDSRKNLSIFFKAFCELQTWITDYDEVEDVEYTCEVDEVFEDKIEIEWQGHIINVFECPGHSVGSEIICIDKTIVFSGDSILGDTKTECSLPGGTKTKWNSIGFPLVKSLPMDAIVYPGHRDRFVLKDSAIFS